MEGCRRQPGHAGSLLELGEARSGLTRPLEGAGSRQICKCGRLASTAVRQCLSVVLSLRCSAWLGAPGSSCRSRAFGPHLPFLFPRRHEVILQPVLPSLLHPLPLLHSFSVPSASVWCPGSGAHQWPAKVGACWGGVLGRRATPKVGPLALGDHLLWEGS